MEKSFTIYYFLSDEDLSSSLDFSTDYDTSRPNQVVNNQLIIYESVFLQNNLKFNLYVGHFINNLQEWEKWTKPAFDIDLSNTQISPSVRYNLGIITIKLLYLFKLYRICLLYF